jgi:hypothetical protein
MGVADAASFQPSFHQGLVCAVNDSVEGCAAAVNVTAT